MAMLLAGICCVQAVEGETMSLGSRPLKVFILAGQSNMEGHAQARTFDHIGMDPVTAPMLEKMLGPDGEPRVLDDVLIASIRGEAVTEELFGPLNVGFGAERHGPKIGPEYTFGIYMHEALREPILLIKTAWGGKSLSFDFRPPRAGEWTPPPVDPELEDVQKPDPLPIPASLDIPVGFVPSREHFNPFTRLPGFFLYKGLRGADMGQHNGVYPIYICQDIRADVDDFPLRKGDVIVGINGEGLTENPRDHWRRVVWNEVMKSEVDWTLTVARWRDGNIKSFDIDFAAIAFPGGRADIPEFFRQQERERQEKAQDEGLYYRLMIKYIQHVLADIERVYPDYDPEQGYEIAGFVWFQGWNDLVDGNAYPRRGQPGGYDMYSWLLSQLIRDVRTDLAAPDMPFVIGVLGVDGHTEQHREFRQAMAAPASKPEFEGTVKAVETADFWDAQLEDLSRRANRINMKRTELSMKHGLQGAELTEALAAYEATVWTPEEKAIHAAGVSNAGFHYLGSAKILGQIGKAFAEAMVELIK